MGQLSTGLTPVCAQTPPCQTEDSPEHHFSEFTRLTQFPHQLERTRWSLCLQHFNSSLYQVPNGTCVQPSCLHCLRSIWWKADYFDKIHRMKMKSHTYNYATSQIILASAKAIAVCVLLLWNLAELRNNLKWADPKSGDVNIYYKMIFVLVHFFSLKCSTVSKEKYYFLDFREQTEVSTLLPLCGSEWWKSSLQAWCQELLWAITPPSSCSW